MDMRAVRARNAPAPEVRCERCGDETLMEEKIRHQGLCFPCATERETSTPFLEGAPSIH
jgi:formylmethanofuran dehydrogenase subunit E